MKGPARAGLGKMEGPDARTVLVLEDSVIVAMDIEVELSERGYRPVSAGTIAAATARIGEGPVVAALLDLHLPDGNALPLALTLHRLGTLVALVSGSEADHVAPDCAHVTHFAKPISAARLVDWLDASLNATSSGPNTRPEV